MVVAMYNQEELGGVTVVNLESVSESRSVVVGVGDWTNLSKRARSIDVELL